MEAGVLVRAYRKLFAKGDGMGFLTEAMRMGSGGQLIRPADYARQIMAYRGIVYSCVKVKSNAVASVPFKLLTTQTNGRKLRYTPTRELSTKQKDFLFSQDILHPYLKAADNVEEITEHPILDLLRNVSGHKNAFDLRFETEMFLSLTGNCFWYLPKNGIDKPAFVWILHPQYMSIVANNDGTIKEYVYKRGTKEIHYKPDEIIHFTQSSPHNHYWGMGDVAGAADAIELREYMTGYEKNVFKGMGYPEIALKSSKPINTKQQADEIKRRWLQQYGGGKGEKVAVLEDWLEVVPLQIIHPRDMQYKTGWDTMREEVCNGFGVPISFFSDKGSALGTADKDERLFARYTVLPDIRRQVEKLNEQLIPLYDGGGYFFGFDDPVPENMEQKLKETEILVTAGVITRDEARTIWDYPPMGADELLVPSTLTPLDDLGDTEMEREIMGRVKDTLSKLSA